MFFKELLDEDFVNINKILSTTNYNGSEYSKIYLKAWRFFSSKRMEIAYEEDMIFIRFSPCYDYFDKRFSSKYLYLPPLCVIEKVEEAILKIVKQVKEDQDTLFIMSVPQEYVDAIRHLNLSIKEDVNYAEYLYNPQDLITLSGKKYHSKRNHIANFDKNYNYEFREYTKADFDKVMELFFEWEETKHDELTKEESLEESDEYRALKIELELVLREENAFADMLFVDEKLVAFSLGEITSSNVGIVHVEKSNTNYIGAYAKINQLFSKKHFSGVRIVNRQEDIGIEGLRKSKMSYHPVAFAKKFLIF